MAGTLAVKGLYFASDSGGAGPGPGPGHGVAAFIRKIGEATVVTHQSPHLNESNAFVTIVEPTVRGNEELFDSLELIRITRTRSSRAVDRDARVHKILWDSVVGVLEIESRNCALAAAF